MSVSIKNQGISTIVFISDLHFDFVNGKYCIEQSEQIKDSFISYIKENFTYSIICILGDCFNDWNKTLSFIKELENQHIRGFFVLGNHDYWSGGTKSYKEILQIFADETKNQKYFRLLLTGRKYYIENVCFIGDTGWTSFVQNGKRVDLYQFMKLPDAINVKGFSTKDVLAMHNRWIKYANRILEQERNVIVLTHFPMISFSRNPQDCWWSSETKLAEKKNCWVLFGHTHLNRQRKRNHISSQRGYNNKDIAALKEYEQLQFTTQYNEYDFGLLVKVVASSKLATINLSALSGFYSPVIIENPETQIELVKDVKCRGFKRSSRNWKILAELANNPQEYIKKVKKIMNGYEKSEHIGYRYAFDLSEKTIYSVHTAIACLESIFTRNDFSNPALFVMSAIITGYVYNYMPEQIARMRPIDYYDIVRFFLVFQTMKKFNLGFEDIDSIRKHTSRKVVLANVPVSLPTLNGRCLTENEAYACLKHTLLLHESTNNYISQ